MAVRARPRLVHLTTVDMSLELLLGPQLRAFRDAGYEVIGASAPGPYVEQLEAGGIRHVPVRHATRSMRPDRDARALNELRSLFRRLQPDIVHTHNPTPGIYGRLAARAAKVPVVVNTVHGLYAQPGDPWSKRALVYRLERLAAACSHAELVQNPEDLPVLARIGVPQAKLHLLGNGIDLDRFDPASVPDHAVRALRADLGLGDAMVVGLVGRLVREKGYRDVFAAAAALRDLDPPLTFLVVGPHDPAKADALTESELGRARTLGVRFLGLRHDVEALYRLMDVYVLASHREGFPRSAMEAAAMGVPIVATDIRGCRQVVDHDVTGLLVPAREPTALAAAIEALATDPDRRHTMSAAAVERARTHFDQQRVIDITLDAYRR